jgi:hypothetical protein
MEIIFDWLQNWYKSQCDGDWEHEYGIKIETVDNPGWYVVIDLIGTECEGHLFLPVQTDIDESNWFFCKLNNNIFEASCDACNLSKVLQIFRDWVENCQKKNVP